MTTHDPYILIVEDEPHIAHLLEVNLQLEAYLSMPTETAKEAWSQVIKKQPALVLLDVMLPDSSGIELCQRLKKNHPDLFEKAKEYEALSDGFTWCEGRTLDEIAALPEQPLPIIDESQGCAICHL